MESDEKYWKSINYLRGLAIISVLYYHFIGHNGAYANTIISIFFVVSGYGLYYSLEKRFNEGVSFGKIFEFYVARFFRIYILLFVGLFIYSHYYNETYNWLAFSGLYITGPYWFISAIIHCYIVSVPLYLLFKGSMKSSVKYYFLFVTTFIILLNMFYFGLIPPDIRSPISEPFIYRFLFMPYLLLFAYGITLPYFLNRGPKTFPDESPYKSTLLATILIVFYFLVGKLANGTFKFIEDVPLNYKYAIYLLIMIIVAPVMIFFFLRSSEKVVPPFRWFIGLLVTYSLSIYLFHTIYYKIVPTTLGFKLYWTAPLFLLVCILIESLVGWIRKWVVRLLQRFKYLLCLFQRDIIPLPFLSSSGRRVLLLFLSSSLKPIGL